MLGFKERVKNQAHRERTGKVIKSELIVKLGRKQHHLSEKDVAISVNAIIDKMIDCLKENGRIEIRDFGSFNLHHRPPRLAHNPKTGEKLTTEAKYAIHFKPGKAMKERINISAATHPIVEVEDELEE